MSYRLLLIDSLVLKVQAYLHSEISLALLENWVLDNLQGILQTEDREGIHLANLIISLCTHLEETVISEEEIRADLQACIEQLEDLPTNTVSSANTLTATEGRPVDAVDYSFV